MSKITSYKLNDVFCPLIFANLNGGIKGIIESRYKIDVNVHSDSDVDVSLGIQLVDEKREFLTLELLGKYTLNGVVPNVQFAEELPLVHNLLASLYPYLREKVHYILFANKINFHLESMNLVQFLKENQKTFKVEDFRK